MCSAGDQTAKNLETAQAAMTQTLNTDYSTSFAEQQQFLQQQQAKLNYLAANPMGYTPQQLATSRTAINENTATAAKQAIGAAAAYGATHGAADIGGGATGQIAGEIASGAALAKSQELASLSQQDQQLKQENFWKSIQGLNQVGAEYGGGASTAISGATSTAGTSTSAGQLALASQQAGWQDVGGMISGIGGLALTGGKIATGSYGS